jgi:hypothetical protein
MLFRGYKIAVDKDFDGLRVYFVELRDGSFVDFPSLGEAKGFIREITDAAREAAISH